jgi:hypothetical protein
VARRNAGVTRRERRGDAARAHGECTGVTRHAGLYRVSGMDVGEESRPPASSRTAGYCARGRQWTEEDMRNGGARAVTEVARAVRWRDKNGEVGRQE